MDFSIYTRQVEECRKRWNRQTFEYVLAVARIVRRARDAGENQRHWCRWIRRELRMDPSTVQRYFRIEAFLKANADTYPHLKTLTISKVDALARLPLDDAKQLILDGSKLKMADRGFLRLIRRMLHRKPNRSTLANLTSLMEAAVRRVEVSVQKWNNSALTIPAELKARIRRKLHRLTEMLHQMERRAAAM